MTTKVNRDEDPMGVAQAVGLPVPSTEFECQNCGELFELHDLQPIKDIFERVTPGEPMPAGECPDCGALCHQRA